MIILGIDPGSINAGYGLIRIEGRKQIYLQSGVMNYGGKKDFLSRLGEIYRSCEQLIEHYKPDEVSLESLIYVKSVTSLAKLAQARGAMVAAFMKTHEGKVFEYSPNLVKSTVTGHGHANKEAVDKTMKLIFGKQLEKEFKSHDESDALAVAICHSMLKGNVVKKKSNRYSSGGRTLQDVFKGRA